MLNITVRKYVIVQPLAAAEACNVSGTIAVGRQMTAPPALYQRNILLGHRRTAAIHVAVKGSRADIKLYTDLQLAVEGLTASYGPAMLPYIALVRFKIQEMFFGILCNSIFHIALCKYEGLLQKSAVPHHVLLSHRMKSRYVGIVFCCKERAVT